MLRPHLVGVHERHRQILVGVAVRERFPDPRQDNSFKKYLNDPKFQETVQYMVF